MQLFLYKDSKKKQIKQGCFKQSCLKTAFFTETVINQQFTFDIIKG